MQDKEPRKAPKVETEDTFPLQDLKDNSMVIFGQPHYVIAGALHGETPKEFYTKSEISAKIDKFMKMEVK
jgi:hypothetical protein